MTQAIFTLSAFGDEIAHDLETQLDVLAAEGIAALELRAAWGQKILDLDQAQLARAATLLRARGFQVSAIGSPIGKSPLDAPRTFELERLERAIAAADLLGTRSIRVFSFYVDADAHATCRDEVLARMELLAERAARAGVILLHENEKHIYGDTPERCRDILATVGSPALRMAFDPANFVQVGVAPLARAWPLLAEDTVHVHVKDALFATGEVRPAGAGDGEIGGLLAALAARGYHGFLTLEPHLAIAGPAGGFSGVERMHTAVCALRALLADLPA